MASVKISALPEVSSTTDVALAGVETGVTKKMSNSIDSAKVITALGFTPAPIASPVFTGNPTAPTAVLTDDSTSIATTAFVKDQGYVTAVTAPVTSVSGKTGAVSLVVTDVGGAAPIASPNFTGTPMAITPSPGDNSTRLATTAFIVSAALQPGIQFQDEGSNIGAQGGENIVNFTGGGITATAVGATVTVNVPLGGSVSSVGLTAPSEFSVSGSPVTSTGTLALSKVNQNANLVWAGPTSGGATAPTFRSLVPADIPATSVVRGPGCNFTNGGLVLSNTITGEVVVPYGGTITGWTIIGDAAGSASIVVQKSTYANYDTMTTLFTATVTTAVKNQATGLSHILAAGDILRFVGGGFSVFSRVEITLTVAP